ncbi:unnamed protein product, partial [Cylindrotheca closterium]
KYSKFKDGTKPGKTGKDYPKWKIPPIPNSWAPMMTNGVWKLLHDWKQFANGTTKDPMLILEKFRITQQDSCIEEKHPKKRKNRCGNRKEDHVSDGDSDDDNDSSRPTPTKTTRFVLASPRLNRKTGRKQIKIVTDIKS